METLVLLLASYAVCFGVMNDKFWPISLLRRFGWFSRMFDCPYCTGFHTGWMVGLSWRVLHPEWGSWVGVLFFALASSSFCYTLDVALRRLELNEA